VVLLTTARKDCAEVMAMSWHMMVEFEAPLVACVVSSAGQSFAALRATKEWVIAVPPAELAPKVVNVGNCPGREVEKFGRFGLTPAPAERVAPHLVAKCFTPVPSWFTGSDNERWGASCVSLSCMPHSDFHPCGWAAGPCETRKFCLRMELQIEED